MNCIPSLKISSLLLALACAACNTQVSEPRSPADPLAYQVNYRVSHAGSDGTLDVQMQVSQSRSLLREVRMQPDDRFEFIRGDGDLLVENDLVIWRPPERGGSMTWRVDVNHLRNGQGYDAWLGTDWGVFRAEDIIPRAATRTLKGAFSETWLGFDLPRAWSSVTQYYSNDGRSRIDNAERRFDQPSGWIVIGDLGVRREVIAGVRVAVAGPTGQSIRRLDTLALLHWTLPELARLLPELPGRITIVSAGEPMWRGGLSAPQSLFLHADRPLISENATSTLLHEVMHMSLRLRAAEGYDWIVEGLAEYYSLQLLQRTGTISADRYEDARRDLAEWARSAGALCHKVSSGARTAKAVGVFSRLDAELRKMTAGKANLDDVTASLWYSTGPVDLESLQAAAEQIAGAKPDTLRIAKLPGCRTIAAADSE